MQAVRDVMDRAMSDTAFRKLLSSAPADVLAAYDLTPEERAAFVTGTVSAERLEERMSKTDLSAAVSAKTAAPSMRPPSKDRRG